MTTLTMTATEFGYSPAQLSAGLGKIPPLVRTPSDDLVPRETRMAASPITSSSQPLFAGSFVLQPQPTKLSRNSKSDLTSRRTDGIASSDTEGVIPCAPQTNGSMSQSLLASIKSVSQSLSPSAFLMGRKSLPPTDTAVDSTQRQSSTSPMPSSSVTSLPGAIGAETSTSVPQSKLFVPVKPQAQVHTSQPVVRGSPLLEQVESVDEDSRRVSPVLPTLLSSPRTVTAVALCSPAATAAIQSSAPKLSFQSVAQCSSQQQLPQMSTGRTQSQQQLAAQSQSPFQPILHTRSEEARRGTSTSQKCLQARDRLREKDRGRRVRFGESIVHSLSCSSILATATPQRTTLRSSPLLREDSEDSTSPPAASIMSTVRSILKVKLSHQYASLLHSHHTQQLLSQSGNIQNINQGVNAARPPGDLFSNLSPIASTINTINTINNTLLNKRSSQFEVESSLAPVSFTNLQTSVQSTSASFSSSLPTDLKSTRDSFAVAHNKRSNNTSHAPVRSLTPSNRPSTANASSMPMPVATNSPVSPAAAFASATNSSRPRSASPAVKLTATFPATSSLQPQLQQQSLRARRR